LVSRDSYDSKQFKVRHGNKMENRRGCYRFASPFLKAQYISREEKGNAFVGGIGLTRILDKSE